MRISLFKVFTCTVFLCSFTWITNAQSDTRTQNRPNIVYIMADDLGYNHLGVYGQKKIKTPHIDKLASQGMRFTQFYAGANVCGPSRTTLMLGLHTGHLPYRENRDYHLAHEYAPYGKLKTLAQMFKEAGYQTGYFGKYGIGGPEVEPNSLKPNDIGFDVFWGLVEHGHGHIHYPDYIWHNKEKIKLNNDTRSSTRAFGKSSLKPEERREHTDDIFSEEAINFIKEKSQSDAPFFCYLSFSLPHTEMLATEKFVEPYRKLGWEEYPSINNGHHVPVNTPRANFAGMVSQIDHWTGQVVKALDEMGIADTTIVIFTSDNGGQLRETWGDAPSVFFEANGPLRKGKTWNYEGGIRVPMIVRWPGNVAPNSINDHMGYFPDFMPTFAEISGFEPFSKGDGISFLSTLTGNDKKQEQHDYLYWELPKYTRESNGNRHIHKTTLRQAIRFGNWKAIREDTQGNIELYNLESDIGEQNNVAVQYPKLVKKAAKILDKAHFDPLNLPDNK